MTENGPSHYEIRVRGGLDRRWATWFDGMVLSTASDQGADATTIRGPVPDQAALHGVLQKIRDLGLPLISVVSLDAPHHEGDRHVDHHLDHTTDDGRD
jgi:hypothetical protein